MLRLSKKADYALIAMKHLALRPDQAASSAREIAEQYDIPVELMAKVLQRLAREGLLASHQGTRGGYQLSRPPSNISVADVIQAVDGPLTVTACRPKRELRSVWKERAIVWKIRSVSRRLQNCSITKARAESRSRPDLFHARDSPKDTVVEPHSLIRTARPGRPARARGLRPFFRY